MKTAIILFNLGGPDELKNVKPFLFNLFKDRAILNIPALIRYPLAAFISSRREKEAQHIYSAIGGASPLLANTKAQGAALEKKLNDGNGAEEYRCFIAMRYWHPLTQETARDVKAYAPQRILYLPLYPQYSTTTTQSSFAAMDAALAQEGVVAENIRKICCYPREAGFIAAYAALARKAYDEAALAAKAAGCAKPPRILFSAHGLPEKVVRAGDPYQWQVMESCKAVVAALNIPALDWVNCFQSRVGPLKWIGPYTDAEIERAGAEKVPLVIVPIAFVSEHSETLYEIEQQYRALAAEKGVPAFARVPAVGVADAFVDGLAAMARADAPPSCTSNCGQRLCPGDYGKCPAR